MSMLSRDAAEFATIGGAPGVDILGSTPGFAGPLQSGAQALAQQHARITEQQQRNRENILGSALFNFGKAVEAPAVATTEFFKVTFTRGVYLIVGTILFIIGLVILSKSAQEGIGEGLKQALNERH